jgi:plastocyanin
VKKNTKLVIVIAAAIVVIGAIVTVASMGTKSSNSMGNMSSSSSAVASNSVAIENYMFSPAMIKVKVGTKVTWTNKDPVNHTITADTNSTDAPNSMDVAQGKSYSFTFAKAGTYAYHCFPHPYMHGTVIVE